MWYFDTFNVEEVVSNVLRTWDEVVSNVEEVSGDEIVVFGSWNLVDSCYILI